MYAQELTASVSVFVSTSQISKLREGAKLQLRNLNYPETYLLFA